MKPINFIMKAFIVLSVIFELFVLITIFDIVQTKSNGGDIITFAQDTKISGQNLSEGTYVMSRQGFVKLNNYWVYETKIFTITIPMLILIISLIILKNINKKKNSDIDHKLKKSNAPILETVDKLQETGLHFQCISLADLQKLQSLLNEVFNDFNKKYPTAMFNKPDISVCSDGVVISFPVRHKDEKEVLDMANHFNSLLIAKGLHSS